MMPEAAIAAVEVDKVLPLEAIGPFLAELGEVK
jgi:chemotaxis response regulator CheB